MRRANGFHILSLILACLGSAAWVHAVDAGAAAGVGGAVALLLSAAGCATFAVRRSRSEREALVRHLRQAAAAVRPGDARFEASAVDAEALGAAVDGLVAASRAQSIATRGRVRELEARLRDATAAAAVAAAAPAVSPIDPPSGPTAAGGQPTGPIARLAAEFVALVSHEVRTPLASIRAYSEMLVDGEAADERSRQEFARVLLAEAARLDESVGNVLALARLEAGLSAAVVRPASLRALVEQAMAAAAPAAAAKRVEVVASLAADDGDHHRVTADPALVRQAAANLLAHAIQYTPEAGRVVVTTGVDPAGRQVSFRVEDGGPGIAPDDLPFAFGASYGGADGTADRPGPGAGLGLALARRVIEAGHGGRVHARNVPGRGACLGFDLPRAARAEGTGDAGTRAGAA